MIVIDPVNMMLHPKAIQAFYKKLLSNVGVPTKSINVEAYQMQGDIDVTNAQADRLFDIGNPSFGPFDPATVATYGARTRTFLHGNLWTNNYISAKSTPDPGRYHASLGSGPAIAPTFWLFKRRNQITNYDTNVATPAAPGMNSQGFLDLTTPPGIIRTADLFLDSFMSILFNYYRLEISVDLGTMTVRTEYIFNGVRIDYT